MTTVRSDLLLARSSYQTLINAPVDNVDIGKWLLGLPDAEYQRCAPPDHIAAGFTTTDNGRPMSINVEKIGDSLIVEHYVGEVVDKLHCKMVSISDVFTEDGGRTWRDSLDRSGYQGVIGARFLGFEDDRTARVALGDGSIWTTYDAGRTWTRSDPF